MFDGVDRRATYAPAQLHLLGHTGAGWGYSLSVIDPSEGQRWQPCTAAPVVLDASTNSDAGGWSTLLVARALSD